MQRREFLKKNTCFIAGLPLFSLPVLPFRTIGENPDFPFKKDFPEVFKKFELQKQVVKASSILLKKSVENETAFINENGAVRFRGYELPASIILDFGKEVVGSYSFVAQAEKVTEIKITYGEGIDEVLNGFKGINWYHHPMDFYLVNNRNVYQLKGRRAFRYLRIDTSGDVTIESLTMVHQHYPVIERGSFYCSDPELNQMWQVGSYTTKICMQQFYEDGIKRDGLLWVSDYRIQFLCNAYSFGDSALARKSLFMIAASQRKDGAIPACSAHGGGHQHPENINYMGGIPFSFGAHWILINYSSDFFSCLNDYIVYSGDESILPSMIPTLERLLSFLESVDYRPNPKMPMGRDRLTDDAGIPIGQSGILQGTFLFQVFSNLKDGEALLKEIRPDLSIRCTNLASTVEKLIDQEHYDSTRKIYTDFPGSNDQISWHTNAFAVLAGKVSSDESIDLLKRASELTVFSPAIGAMKHFQVEALLEAGWVDKAIEEMKAYWGLQLKEGATTFWEYLNMDKKTDNFWESALMSRCHGWSAGPTYLLPRFFLGVRPLTSWSKVSIKPFMKEIEWAEGTVPTPFGEIFISWHRGNKALINLPDKISAEWEYDGQLLYLEPGRSHIISLLKS